MKMHKAATTAATCLTAVLLMAVSTAKTSGATALQGRISVRPLTPQEVKAPSLVGLQGASGLSTVGKGQPVYLDALVNSAIAPSNLVAVTWVLTTKPAGSLAALVPSPLGTNVPIYSMKDRTISQIAGRMMLRPDVVGQYTVLATIAATGSGSTNVTQIVTAGTYLGNDTCAYCHGGGPLAPDKYEGWLGTGHATFFTRAIDGAVSDHYGKNCISCHTVGYDANTNAVNGGFDDIAKQLGWTFPAVLTNGNWAAMPHELQVVANIGCENCHGAGSEHAFAALLTGPDAAKARISKTFAAGDCAQCHDSLNTHYRSAEWNNSRHAVATSTPSGPTRAACARCHTASGFAAYADTLSTGEAWTGTNVAYTAYEAITCSTCHDPHDASNPHQLRAPEVVKLADGPTVATITNAGAGALCMNCHQSRSGSYTNSLVGYPLGKPTYPGGSSSFGPHDNPAADMLEGVNGYTYGQVIPSSAHRSSVTDTCAGCHMQTVTSTDPAFTKAGGHTFSMTYSVGSNGITNTVDKVNACVQCHGPITSFDMIKVDYNGDGLIEGVQTEVQKLYDRLSTLLPNSTYRADGNYVADGLVKSPSVKTNWQAKFLQGAWNYQLVKNDLSKGIHNTAYAVGLLKASIADLSGDSNNDSIADSWQKQYFGANFASDPNAAPNASPAGDGIPNWLKYTLGLDPHVAGVVVPDGVVWANGGTIGGGTNTIHIYTAAEVVFDTEVGKTYQIQAASAVSGGWQNIGAPIAGTGAAVSYVTPTRKNVQQFYRVAHTP
jgi:hypothetical protein